jgi:hypothetical protein
MALVIDTEKKLKNGASTYTTTPNIPEANPMTSEFTPTTPALYVVI